MQWEITMGKMIMQKTFEEIAVTCPSRLFGRYCDLTMKGCCKENCAVWHFVYAAHPPLDPVVDHEKLRRETGRKAFFKSTERKPR
jgi:hypothetical protein